MKTTLKRPRTWFLAAAVLLVLSCIPFVLTVALNENSQDGHLSVVNHLLAIGVAPTNDALGAAAINGHTAVVRSLLAAGANPNATNDIDETVLAYATQEGHIEVVRVMLDYGADPNWGCREVDPLNCARLGGYPEIAKLLKQHGAKE